mgnify:CR=1 FL=1
MAVIGKENRALVLRSNRFLANRLSEVGLVTDDDINEANQKLLEAIEAGNPRQVSILNSLIFELKRLDEKDYIDFVLNECQVGLIALRNYRIRPMGNEMNDPDVCWATWTVPFDRVGDYYLVATAYYPSKPVIEHWEKIADMPIIWYGATIQGITESIDRLTRDETVEDEA